MRKPVMYAVGKDAQRFATFQRLIISEMVDRTQGTKRFTQFQNAEASDGIFQSGDGTEYQPRIWAPKGHDVFPHGFARHNNFLSAPPGLGRSTYRYILK
jgi:hypothetical protein